MKEVVGGLFIKDGKFMICQRPASKARGLLWEFVGGKVENGESKEEALKRECREELDADIKVKEKFMELDYEYPDISIHFTVFLADILSEPKLLEHNDLKWIYPAEIDNYEFCPADRDILKKIKEIY